MENRRAPKSIEQTADKPNWCYLRSSITGAKEKKILEYNRGQIRALTQMVTGHANLKRHRNVMGMEDDEDCHYCGDSQTAIHYTFSQNVQDFSNSGCRNLATGLLIQWL